MSTPMIPYLDLEWSETGPPENPRSRLGATICVAGVMLHLEAWEMILDRDGIQQFAAWPESMTQVFDAFGVEGRWDVLVLNGRRYALLASPFCNGTEVDPR